MSDRPVDDAAGALEPELAALLETERARPGMPADVGARLLRRGETALALRAGPASGTRGGEGGDRGDGGGGSGGGGHQSPPAAASHVAAGARAARLARALAPWLLGAAAGAAVHAAASRPPPARTVVVTRTVTVTAPGAPPAPPARTPDAPQPGASTALPPTRDAAPRPRLERPATEPRRDGAGRDEGLAAERMALDVAAAALGRRRPTEALAALAAHARTFPRGQLAEERESLWIQALVLAGRRDEARARASRFERLYPLSMFRPAVESALGSISQRTDH